MFEVIHKAMYLALSQEQLWWA